MPDLRNELLNFFCILADDEPELILNRKLVLGGWTVQLADGWPVQLAGQVYPKVADPRDSFALQELAIEASACVLCRLAETRQNVVFGVGNPHADLMFIGEAPGADEDRQGEPFVGRAGQLLTKMLKAINLERSQVYIANILKCRPPGNRDPEPDEMESCYPFLKQQIELIRPSIIIALGRVAAIKLLELSPTVSLKSMRGRIFNYNSRPLIVTYHPAALLRSAGLKPQAWEDLQFVLKLHQGQIKWQPEENVRL